MSGKQLIKDHAERVDIRGSGDRLAANLLRARIFRSHRTEDSGFCTARRVQEFGDTEIEKFWAAILGDENIAGFDVAVNHQPLVRILHGPADLAK